MSGCRRHYWLGVALLCGAPALAQFDKPGTGAAKGTAVPAPQPTPAAGAQAEPPIVPDAEFNAALPPLSGDINAPLEPMPSRQAMTPPATAAAPPAAAPLGTRPAPLPAATTAQPLGVGDTLPAVGPEDPALAQPLVPLAGFDSTPLATAADIASTKAPAVHYETTITGLDKVKLEDQWKALSSLRSGHGKAANAVQVRARASEDEALAIRLMKSVGYYDASAVSVVEPVPNQPGQLKATVTASPGRLYTLSSVTLVTGPVVPPDLLTGHFALKKGDAIDAARIQGAEANLSLLGPRKGYPFLKTGDRDILLDDQTPTGAYTLPIDTGPRASFGRIVTKGDDVFGLDHLALFPRYQEGDLYDSRWTDDLRDALVATGLFGGLSVVPQRTGRPGPDGTEAVDLLVTQTRGPSRSLGGTVGYSTGEGFRAEGTWTLRNLFPDEGALILSAIGGTQEQGLSSTFRRANAGERDRTFTVVASADHSSYDAYNANTLTLSARWSYDSTPIWQKRITYYYGVELVGTNESVYDFGLGETVRRDYGIVALPLQIEWDTSNDLLNPTKGHRLTLDLSPETSVQGSVHPYVRTMVEGDFYFPVGDSLVLAGRAKAGSIFGIDRDDLAPSRRYYGGGGGSVRGYGYQRLGPFDPDGNPVGGRSLNEFGAEARYRFGNFGIVPFVDAGNSYESSVPQFNDLRFGAGIGGRFYTNFGPFRIDVATPLNPRPGDSKIALYISLGQAF